MSAVQRAKEDAPTSSAPPILTPTRPATPPASPARTGAASVPTPPFPTIRVDGLGLAPWATPWALSPPRADHAALGLSTPPKTPGKGKGKGRASPGQRRRWASERAAAAKPPSPSTPTPARTPFEQELEELDAALRLRHGLPEGTPLAAPDPEGSPPSFGVERLEDAAETGDPDENWSVEGSIRIVRIESFAVGANRDLDADSDPDRHSPPPPFPGDGEPSSEEEDDVRSGRPEAIRAPASSGPLIIIPWPALRDDDDDAGATH